MNTRSTTTLKHSTGSSRLARRLIELGEYAKREGITPQDVKKCSEIGVVQLRRHKGKTYVVDMPVCSYDNTDEVDTEVAELLGLIQPRTQASSRQQTPPASTRPSTTERISKVLSPARNLAQRLFRNVQQALNKTSNHKESDHEHTHITDDKRQQSVVRPPSSGVRFEPGAISQLVQEMLRRAEEIKAQDEKAARTQTAQLITDASQPSKEKTCEMTEELLATMHRQLDQIEQKSTRAQEHKSIKA